MTLATFFQCSAHDLPTIADGSVQAVITSPPYYGLRAYAGEQGVEWPTVTFRMNEWCEPLTIEPMTCGLGMEPSPVAYLGHLILCLREWRRVLRDDGVALVNLGDSYYNYRPGGTSQVKQTVARNTGSVVEYSSKRNLSFGVKEKDLLGIPWMFAIAARADGWYLRSAITWCKGNPMPESVKDRPTKATEMIYLLAKSPRYFWDAEAIAERIGESSVVVTSNLQDKRLVFGENVGPEKASAQRAQVPVLPVDHDGSLLERSVRLATSILDGSKFQNQFGLPFLDTQVRHEGTDNFAGSVVVSIPVIGRATAQAARFTDGDISAKDFLSEMDSLGIALPYRDNFKETGIGSSNTIPTSIPLVNADGNASVTVNDTSKVSQFESVHNQQYNTEDTTSSKRNKRDWWVVNSQPTPYAHFATWPEKLVEPMVKAATSAHGACSQCGAPYERKMEITDRSLRPVRSSDSKYATNGNALTDDGGGTKRSAGQAYQEWRLANPDVTVGWQPTCECAADVVPCTVLDPFNGSGTTGKVAVRLGRQYIGVDIASEYLDGVTAQRFAGGVQMEMIG